MAEPCRTFSAEQSLNVRQWSRFTGGSGAPLWTIYACGVDPYNVTPTYSALVHSDYPSREQPDPQSFPCMIWSSNYYRAFGHLVWTLFFAGKTFAPKCIIDGKNIQDWLHDHYCDAVKELAKVVAAAPGLLDETVIGWDSINEPAEGLIGVQDLSAVPKEQTVTLGPVPTPFENMQLANGQPVEVPCYKFGPLGPTKEGTIVLDPKGKKLWITPEDDEKRGAGKWGFTRGPEWRIGECIWAQHGVWDPAQNKLLRPAYFYTFPTDPDAKVEFVHDFWRLHWLSYASMIRTVHREAIHFMNTTVFKPLPELPESFLQHRACASPHYYDGLTLMTRHWSWFNADALGVLRGKYWSVVQALRIGEQSIRKCIQEQLGQLKMDTTDSLGRSYPTLIGEIGCPYDMDGKAAYGYVDGGKGKGDYSQQQRAWDASVNACDGPNALNYTLWVYVPNHSHEWGDNWNGEDLSLWSPDDCRSAEGEPGQDTSPGGSRASSITMSMGKRPSPKGVELGTEVTAQLLLDGSRAAAAFCRPYPVATVGHPENIEFDINSTRCRIKVRVAPSDTPGVTQIYVPFLHYASDLDWKTNNDALDLASRTSSQQSLLESSDPSSKTGRSTDHLELDVSVRASTGTWTTEGQYLYWTYELPRRETTYTIEIRRNGGPLRVNYNAKRDQGLLADIAEYFGWAKSV